MKSTSHFAIAHLVYASLKNKGVLLDRTAFAYGNIAPDYIPTMVFPTHFSKTCTRKIEEISRELASRPLHHSGRADADYSMRLGMMCHYICDYFCFAHNKDFTGSLKQHAAFETALDAYMRKNCLELLDIHCEKPLSVSSDCDALMRKLADQKQSYCTQGYTFDNDLRFSFDFCLNAAASLTAMSRRLDARKAQEAMEKELESFATGNCYVFRMFLFKNRNRNIFFLPELLMPPILT